MSEFQLLPLGEAPAAIIDGDRGKEYPKQADFGREGFCLFLNASNVTSSGFNFSDCSFITQAKDQALRKGKLERGDVVLTTRGTVGNVALYDESAPFAHVRINSGMVLLRSEQDKLLPRFLYYFLRSRTFNDQVQSLTTGSAQPQFPIRDIRRVMLPLPRLAAQRRIAHILGTLDDKIELNRRMNRTLEAIARAMFKSWFIDFDPVHAKAEGREPVGMNSETCALFPDSFQDSPLGKIPKGWEVTTLDKVADVVDCLHSKKPAPRDSGQLLLQVYNVGRNGELDLSQPFWINEDEYREWTRRIELGSGDLVITKTGRVGAVAQIPFGVKAGLGRNMVGIRSRPSISTPRFMRCLLTSDWMQREIDRMTSDGTILRSLHVKAIEKLRLALPPYRLLKRFEDVCHPVLCLAETNTAEVAELAQTRDALLPRLLSGRLPVGAIGYAGTDD